MKKQKLMRNLFMAALLFGGIFIVGSESNVYAQDGGGTIGSGTIAGGLIGSGTRTGEGNGNGSTEIGGQTVGSGGRIMEPDTATTFFWQSVWRLFL